MSIPTALNVIYTFFSKSDPKRERLVSFQLYFFCFLKPLAIAAYRTRGRGSWSIFAHAHSRLLRKSANSCHKDVLTTLSCTWELRCFAVTANAMDMRIYVLLKRRELTQSDWTRSKQIRLV